jgi:CMP-N-acetylneuraminic acid synthetase
VNVAIIPARGNSKGVKRKNLRPLGGKPLIQWTIDAAKESGAFDYIVVTSEDDEILKLASQSKVMGIVRPPYLSQDFVQTGEVALDALRQLQLANVNPDILAILQPTSPFRTAEDIQGALKRFHYGDGADGWLDYAGTVISAYHSTKYHWHAEEYNEVLPLYHNPQKRLGRQWEQEMGMYVENGAIYIVSAARFGREGCYRLPPYRIYDMPEERSVDIDSESEMRLAVRLYEERLT